jgi:hypothetical protein
VPVAGATQPVENEAVETPAFVEIAPGPETPVVLVHVSFEYSVNVTGPVGATAVVLANVAVSPTVVAVPTVIAVGPACVVNVGEPGPTAITSSAAPQAVEIARLLESPA